MCGLSVVGPQLAAVHSVASPSLTNCCSRAVISAIAYP